MDEPIAAAIRRAQKWLTENPSKTIPEVADEAWYHQMVLYRLGEPAEPGPTRPSSSEALDGSELFHESIQESSKAIERLLDLATDLPLDFDAAHFESKQACCDAAMGTLMLGHLLHVRRRSDERTAGIVEAIASAFHSHSRYLCSFNFLYNRSYQFNLEGMGSSLPTKSSVKPHFAGLGDELRRVVEGYHHSHVIMFGSKLLEVGRLPGPPYEASIRYILDNARSTMVNGQTDLVAEFAICLSLCGVQNRILEEIEQYLLDNQVGAGYWVDFGGERRAVRHCTYVGVLALLLSLRRQAECPLA